MPEYHIDTSGAIERPADYKGFGVERALTWADLDYFVQGYIEAMFFTENDPTRTTEEWTDDGDTGEGCIPSDAGFSDLAPEALLRILKDCDAFRETPAFKSLVAAWDAGGISLGSCGFLAEKAGRDFWYTRQGHGCGFWDGDWPEPHGADLIKASKAMGEVYVEFDGRVCVT